MSEPAAPIARPSEHYPETTDRAPVGVVEHYCEHPGCKEWGGWGFARGRGKPAWFCYKHREDDGLGGKRTGGFQE